MVPTLIRAGASKLGLFEHFEQVVRIVSTLEAFGFHTSCDGLVLPWVADGEAADRGKVRRVPMPAWPAVPLLLR